MIHRLIELIERRPWWVVLTALVPAVALSLGMVDLETGALRLTVDPAVSRLLPTHDADRQDYEEMTRQFGSDRNFVVALDLGEVFSEDALRVLSKLTRTLDRLKGVERVVSLATVPNPRTEGEDLDLATFTESGLRDPGRLPELRRTLEEHPLYRGVLVSRDARYAALIVNLRGKLDEDAVEAAVAEIRRIAEEQSPGPVHITGAAVVNRATAELLLQELRFALPAVLGIAAVILFVAFGSIRALLAGIATVALSSSMVCGILGWLDRPFNLVTVIVPPFVATLGVAYAMHVIEAVSETVGGSRQARAAAAVRSIGLAVIVTGVTTGAGLAALGIHPLSAIREFGWLSLAGVVFTVLLSLVFLPGLLAAFGGLTRHPPFAPAFQRAGQELARFSLAHRKPVLRAGIAVLLLAVLGMTRVTVGTEYIENLPSEHPARQDFEAIDRAFGSAMAFGIQLDTNHRDALLEPEMLREIEAFQAWLDDQPEVAGSTSIVDHLKVLNAGVAGGDVAYELPETSEMAKELLIFAGGDAVRDIADAGFRRTLLRVRAGVDDTRAVSALIERVESRARELPGGLSARVTGESVLLTRTLGRIASGQYQSLVGALVLIYGVLAALFSSLRVGLLALLPNAMPIAFYFGALGFLGIPLSPSTSLIACIALGIAVDDTVHYLVRFNAEARRTTREDEATRLALRAVFRPVTYTTVSLCLGFLVFATSELRNQVQFGTLAAATLAFAWLVDITLTPALCSGVRIVTLWDVLRLDLGPAPQSSIALFDGLSPRQTRLFALTADIQTFDAGEAVRREGEAARDMFVVLEGEVKVWTERAGERIVIHHAVRGDMVGEFSFFAERHGATVDSVTASRLLRFEDIDLELMMRRYPRAAARIYANLNKIQSTRILEATQRIESL